MLAVHFTSLGLSEIPDPEILRNEITGTFLLAASLALCGILLIPSAGFALARLAGKPVESISWPWEIKPWVLILGLGISFIIFLVAGNLVIQATPLAWVVLPILHILVIGIPVAWILYLGGRGLPKGSPQRAWGILGAGMTLGPVLIFSLEIIALLVAVVLGALFIALSPDQLHELSLLVDRLRAGNINTIDEILPMFQPFLNNPLIVILVLVFMAGIIPMLEEGLKPIGVWLLLKRHLTPTEGFAAGLLSGAGFALVESLGYTLNPGQSWASSVLLRAPTALMHITACGLAGWGITKAMSQHRIRWFLMGYGSAVAIHGAWNGLTLIAAGSVLKSPDQTGAQIIAGLALLAMVILLGFVFLALIVINHHLRQQVAHAIISPYPESKLASEIISTETESPVNEPHS